MTHLLLMTVHLFLSFLFFLPAYCSWRDANGVQWNFKLLRFKKDGFNCQYGLLNGIDLNMSNEQYWKSEHSWFPIGDNNQIGMIIAGHYEVNACCPAGEYYIDILAGNTRKAICSNHGIQQIYFTFIKRTTSMDIFSFQIANSLDIYNCIGISAHDYRVKKGTLLNRIKIELSTERV